MTEDVRAQLVDDLGTATEIVAEVFPNLEESAEVIAAVFKEIGTIRRVAVAREARRRREESEPVVNLRLYWAVDKVMAQLCGQAVDTEEQKIESWDAFEEAILGLDALRAEFNGAQVAP